LYGQFCVLGLVPFNNKVFFDTNIKHTYGASSYGGSCPALLCALGQTMVRHTKLQVLGGEEVLRLPPKTEETVAGERAWRVVRGCACGGADVWTRAGGWGWCWRCPALRQAALCRAVYTWESWGGRCSFRPAHLLHC
jgi:hypothetical protein